MAGDRAEALARRLFPEDYFDGVDCRAETGREGQPCRICAERAGSGGRGSPRSPQG